MKLRRKKPHSLLPLFSAPDIAFLLLIFIMLVSLINYRIDPVSLQYPIAETGRRIEGERMQEIWIDIEGNYYLNGIPVNMDILEKNLEDLNYNGQNETYLIADRDTYYEKIHDVILILMQHNHRNLTLAIRQGQSHD